MATIDILRQIAALASAEADRLAGIVTPVDPPVDPPILPPDATVTLYAFGESGSTLPVSIRPGETAAMKFNLTVNSSQGQCAIAEQSTGGDAVTYDAWLSVEPGGFPLSPMQHWQYTGGSIHFKVDTFEPWYIPTRLYGPRGYYFFNVRCTSTTGGSFYATYHV